MNVLSVSHNKQRILSNCVHWRVSLATSKYCVIDRFCSHFLTQPLILTPFSPCLPPKMHPLFRRFETVEPVLMTTCVMRPTLQTQKKCICHCLKRPQYLSPLSSLLRQVFDCKTNVEDKRFWQQFSIFHIHFSLIELVVAPMLYRTAWLCWCLKFKILFKTLFGYIWNSRP